MTEEGRREEFFPACGEVSVDQSGGRVEVHGWAEDRVRLVSTPRGAPGQARVVATHQGSRLRVTVERVNHRCWGPAGGRVDIELWVPRATRLDINSGSGEVTVEGIRGRVRVESGSGGIEARKLAGSLALEAGSGSVRVEDCEGGGQLNAGSGDVTVIRSSGTFELETGSGDITLSELTGNLRVETGSGDVQAHRLRGDLALEGSQGDVVIRDLAAGRVMVDLASGDLKLEGYPLPGAHWNLETASGDVLLAIPEAAACAIDVRTSSGGIDCRLPLEARETGPHSLKGVLNRGGGLIQVETASGSVSLGPLAGLWPVAEPDSEQDDASLSVLRMVEEGKITPAEAEALLAALSDAPSEAGDEGAPAEEEATDKEEGGGV